MKFGVMYDFRNPSAWRQPEPALYKSHLDAIVRLEELGYDNAWLTEHHFVEDGYNPSVLPIAAAIAVRTNRIRIGTFVLLLPFHNPVRVAEDAIAVDILSNGRFDLGVGQGYRAEEFQALNIPRPERSARLDEGLDLLHRLFTEREVSFAGKYNRVTGMTLYPRPVQKDGPPIWVGCRTAKATERAARMGFHLLATLGPDPAIPYHAALGKLGRDPKQFNVAQLRAVHLAPTADQAWSEAAPHLHYMMTHYDQWLAEANDAAGDKEVWKINSPADLRDSPIAEGLMIGTAKEVAAKLKKFRAEYACTHFIMASQLPGMDPRVATRSLELFAREVMPDFHD
ncbi:MAG TPA: LLM class flavin-dependent oxidoreductase [Candidatus Binataceae bacterium]|nr:LLM class flavin-dependent oxidoreductase [Candidatus Binataceae bacterium]